jgi:hypothetical protein
MSERGDEIDEVSLTMDSMRDGVDSDRKSTLAWRIALWCVGVPVLIVFCILPFLMLIVTPLVWLDYERSVWHQRHWPVAAASIEHTSVLANKYRTTIHTILEVRFTTSVNRTIITTVSSDDADILDPKVGSTIYVRYDPNDPVHAEWSGHQATSIGEAVGVTCVAAVVLPFYGFIMVVGRKRRREKRARSESWTSEEPLAP